MNRRWRLLSTHALILVIVDARPEITMREMAEAIGVTERQVAAAIADLRADGLLDVGKRGRRNVYKVRRGASLPQSLHALRTVSQFLRLAAPIVASALGGVFSEDQRQRQQRANDSRSRRRPPSRQ